MEAGFDSDIGGNVPDWDNTESRESDEDAAWRDLVARFDAPTTTTEPAPWPERENVPRRRQAGKLGRQIRPLRLTETAVPAGLEIPRKLTGR